MDNSRNPQRSAGVTAAPVKDKSRPWEFLLLCLIVVGGAYWLGVEFGPSVPWQIAKTVIGLGLVIFLHELGHFAVAKWCDVHVEAFSLGFGPAIPGLSFRRGETYYKIAWIPLGGYVKMVGEGSENEEDTNDPRSFKNKTVGQRMAIISAGVVMNLILGLVCFILAFKGGILQEAAVVTYVEPGSPAWMHDVRTGQVIEYIGDKDKPKFKDLQFNVMLSREGEELRMKVAKPGEKPHDFYIMPRRDTHDPKPVIGVGPSSTTQLAIERYLPRKIPPAVSTARSARALTLRPGDIVTAASDPSGAGGMTPLPALKENGTEKTDYRKLCDRFLEFRKEPMAVEVRHADGKTEKVELSACGVGYGDWIVGTTDPVQAGDYDPYEAADLPRDPRNPESGNPDYFVLSERLQRLAGKPMVLKMRHKDENGNATDYDVLLPPAFHQIIPGLRMKMGKVTAVRDGSAASAAGVEPDDRIIGVELTDKAGRVLRVVGKPSNEKPDENVTEKILDPVRLPFDLREWVGDRRGVTAVITVYREDAEQHDDSARRILKSVTWDESRRFDLEVPSRSWVPLSIPELGLAYHVDTTVDSVKPGSEAADKLEPGDVVLSVAVKDLNDKNAEKFGSYVDLYEKKNERKPWWAYVAYSIQEPDVRAIKLKIRRGEDERVVELDLESDPTWPLADRGLRLMPDRRLQIADGPWDAVVLGINETYQFVVKTYMTLRSMITNRVSAVKNLRGPITIALTAFAFAGESLPDFLFFLGMISVNLAVINFLPIPVLDGGHMVFLIYEKLRGRPATEQVRLALTYVGVLLILSLMVFVIFLDVTGIWFH